MLAFFEVSNLALDLINRLGLHLLMILNSFKPWWFKLLGDHFG